MSVGALLLAAGCGERLESRSEKALVLLGGRALFIWSLQALQRAPIIEAIVVVGPVVKLKAALAAAGGAVERIVAWCEGGAERQLQGLRPEIVRYLRTCLKAEINGADVEPEDRDEASDTTTTDPCAQHTRTVAGAANYKQRARSPQCHSTAYPTCLSLKPRAPRTRPSSSSRTWTTA